MAFRTINMIKYDSNQDSILNPKGAQINGPQFFSYKTSEDNLATVSGGTYFDLGNPSAPASSLLFYTVRAGDLIWCSCSDGNVILQATAGTPSITTTVYSTILDGSIVLADLDAGITPSHIVKFAGQPTTAGGAAAEAIAVAGVLATDLAFVQMVDDGTNNTTIVNAVCTADTLTVTFSGDPGADAVINYQVIRAAA